MVALVKFNHFGDMLLRGEHRFASSIAGGSGLTADTFKLALTQLVPLPTHQVYDDIITANMTNTSGYTAGGETLSITLTVAGAVAKVAMADVTFTASGGTIGPFRYGFIYNDRGSSNYLVAFFDHGSSITIASGDNFKVDFDPAAGVFTLT
jgi:hypothetical protein